MHSGSIVDQTFSVVFAIGHYAGARLLRACSVHESAAAVYVRRILFGGIVLAYVFGTLLLTFLALPIPVDGVLLLTFDVNTAYPILWDAYLLDGFACFVTANFSTEYLSAESGFVDLCREAPLVAKPTTKTLKRWKRTTMVIIFVFAGTLGVQIAITILAAMGVVSAPVLMERAAYWGAMPLWFAWTVLGIIAAMATLHIGYHCVFFCNQCEITRLHFRTFCGGLSEENAAAMTRRRVDMYHAEYCRLISMVQSLDHAFRASTFCQLSLVTVGSCLILFLFAKGVTEWQQMISIIFTLSAIVFTFSFTAVPAIFLDNQVYRPKALIRAWFLNYEKHCNIYERAFDEQTRQALGMFMQTINAEDAGITIASLAKLNAQLLLTLASLVLTYFLVIVQFEQTSCAQSMTNITQTCMANGFYSR